MQSTGVLGSNKVEPVPAPEKEINHILTAPQELITNELKQQVESALVPILGIAGEAVKGLFHSITVSAKWEILIRAQDTMKHPNLDDSLTTIPKDTIDKLLHKYFNVR